MRIIFFGTPTFAANNLQHLVANKYEVKAVVTPPDSKKGRGKKLQPCAVKQVALTNSIPVLQPEKLRDEDFISSLKRFNAELFVVVAFRMLPKVVWKIPKKGTINLHASLLPKYRGAAPINRVLINNEKETGISTFFIDQNIDSGEIIQQEIIKLNKITTAAQLHNIMINKGNHILLSTLNSIKNDSVTKTPQKNDTNISSAPKLTKQELRIDWKKSAISIHNLVRGLSPFVDKNNILKNIAICPSAWFYLVNEHNQQKRIKLHLTKVVKSDSHTLPNIRTDNKTYLHVMTNNDAIEILNLQVEGKKPMTIQQFLQGNKITQNHKII